MEGFGSDLDESLIEEEIYSEKDHTMKSESTLEEVRNIQQENQVDLTYFENIIGPEIELSMRMMQNQSSQQQEQQFGLKDEPGVFTMKLLGDFIDEEKIEQQNRAQAKEYVWNNPHNKVIPKTVPPQVKQNTIASQVINPNSDNKGGSVIQKNPFSNPNTNGQNQSSPTNNPPSPDVFQQNSPVSKFKQLPPQSNPFKIDLQPQAQTFQQQQGQTFPQLQPQPQPPVQTFPQQLLPQPQPQPKPQQIQEQNQPPKQSQQPIWKQVQQSQNQVQQNYQQNMNNQQSNQFSQQQQQQQQQSGFSSSRARNMSQQQFVQNFVVRLKSNEDYQPKEFSLPLNMESEILIGRVNPNNQHFFQVTHKDCSRSHVTLAVDQNRNVYLKNATGGNGTYVQCKSETHIFDGAEFLAEGWKMTFRNFTFENGIFRFWLQTKTLDGQENPNLQYELDIFKAPSFNILPAVLVYITQQPQSIAFMICFQNPSSSAFLKLESSEIYQINSQETFLVTPFVELFVSF